MGMVTLRNDSTSARVVYEISGVMTLIEPKRERTLAISEATEKQIRLGMEAGDKFQILGTVKVSDLNYVDGKVPVGAEPISDPLPVAKEPDPPPAPTPAPPSPPKLKAGPKRRKRKPVERVRARQKVED